jgi:hypothetical protein
MVVLLVARSSSPLRPEYNTGLDAKEPALQLVEECAGVGELIAGPQTYQQVSYRISRFQAMAPSGLPIPGLHRIHGSVGIAKLPDAAALVGKPVMLRLEDGRSLALTLAAADGRVLAEGHGPKHGCSCC